MVRFSKAAKKTTAEQKYTGSQQADKKTERKKNEQNKNILETNKQTRKPHGKKWAEQNYTGNQQADKKTEGVYSSNYYTHNDGAASSGGILRRTCFLSVDLRKRRAHNENVG